MIGHSPILAIIERPTRRASASRCTQTAQGRVSRLTLLVYLNDGFEGGATDFRDFAVTPRTGDALLFVHDTWHEGQAVTRGHKYVLRSDVMYADGP